MKATGIVRKADDLGRFVIPKEIRKEFGLELGTPIEIYTDDDCIILKKYSPISKLTNIEKRALLGECINMEKVQQLGLEEKILDLLKES